MCRTGGQALRHMAAGPPISIRPVSADVALGPEEGFLHFCSASMAGPWEGLDDYVFFTGEETNDTVDGDQRGFAVALNTRTGVHSAIRGKGRLNPSMTSPDNLDTSKTSLMVPRRSRPR